MIEDDIRNGILNSTFVVNRTYLRCYSLHNNNITDTLKYRFNNRFIPNTGHYKIPLSLFEELLDSRLVLDPINIIKYQFKESVNSYKTTATILKNGLLPYTSNLITKFKYIDKDNNNIFYYIGKGFLLDANFKPIYCTFVEFDFNNTGNTLADKVANIKLSLEVDPDVIINSSDVMNKSIIKYILPTYAGEEFKIGFDHCTILATTRAKIIINKIEPFLEEPVKPSINNHQVLVKEALVNNTDFNIMNLFNV